MSPFEQLHCSNCFIVKLKYNVWEFLAVKIEQPPLTEEMPLHFVTFIIVSSINRDKGLFTRSVTVPVTVKVDHCANAQAV